MAAAVISAAVRAQLARVAAAAAGAGKRGGKGGLWICADMDSTLIKKVRGEYPDLNASPCRAPLLRFLGLGGRLLVVTSDEGHRPFRQLLAQIEPAALRRRVILSVGDGCLIYRALDSKSGSGDSDDASSSEFVLDQDYLATHRPLLPDPKRVMAIARDITVDFLTQCAKNRELLTSIRPASRQKCYSAVVAHVGPHAPRERMAEYLTEQRCAGRGELPEGFRGTAIWRNVARPRGPSGWAGYGTGGGGGGSNMASDQITTLWCLGIRSDLGPRLVAPYREELASLGVAAEIAPNSILLKNAAVDKGTAIRHLAANGTIDLTCALAIGDNPTGNDAPLTKFREAGMPFLSVASGGPSATPAEIRDLHVGGLELGTAECLAVLCDLMAVNTHPSAATGRL